jgi:hypothetical protein
VMKDSFSFGMDSGRRRRAQSGVRARGDRTAAGTRDLIAAGQRRRSWLRGLGPLRPLVYGFHPYGLPGGSGTPRDADRHHAGRSRQFHRQHFVPNNMLLAIVGDVTSEEALRRPSACSGSWPREKSRPGSPSIRAAAHTPPHRRGQARCGADGDSRRTAGDSPQAPGLPGVGSGRSKILGGEGANGCTGS